MKRISRRTLLRSLSTGSLAWIAAACGAPASPPQSSSTPTTAPAVAPSKTPPPAASSPRPTSSPWPSLTPRPTPPVLGEQDRALMGVTQVKQVARLIGESAINDTPGRWGLNGGDLGSMFDKDGRLYMVFGDSFGCCIPGTGGPGNATDWRYNCMAVITDRDPSDGLTFDSMITDRPGHACQLLPRGKFDKTIIPTYGIAVGSRMFLHYMAVLAWGEPGQWALNESGLAYSDDDGQTWTKDPAMKWDGKSNFGQVAFVRADDQIYVYGIPGGRFGGVALAKVTQTALLDKSAYLYFAGLDGDVPQWQPDEKQAVTIVPAPVGELSVLWNPFLERWLMTYLDSDQYALVIREAKEPWGPWSPALPLASGQEFPGLYGAYMHPWLVENDGKTIYFTMSQWNPYAVFLMQAKLARI